MARSTFFFALVILAALLSKHSFAQKNNAPYQNQIKFTPGKLLDPVNPGVELSFERRYGRFATEIGGVYQTNIIRYSDYTDYKGWKIAVEEKYFIRMKRKVSHYVSGELATLNVDYNSSGIFAKDTMTGTPTYNDDFRVSKKTYSLNFKYGFEVTIRHFVLDFSAGVGIKYISAKRTGVQDPNAFEEGPRHPNVFHMANQDGDRFGGNVPIVFAVGFSF